ncbi:unnamed protein product [Pedinophyceae sp. YPF-701]|nr:unnamed protein product [Pedinophyceae sp. YPF-701]
MKRSGRNAKKTRDQGDSRTTQRVSKRAKRSVQTVEDSDNENEPTEPQTPGEPSSVLDDLQTILRCPVRRALRSGLNETTTRQEAAQLVDLMQRASPADTQGRVALCNVLIATKTTDVASSVIEEGVLEALHEWLLESQNPFNAAVIERVLRCLATLPLDQAERKPSEKLRDTLKGFAESTEKDAEPLRAAAEAAARCVAAALTEPEPPKPEPRSALPTGREIEEIVQHSPRKKARPDPARPSAPAQTGRGWADAFTSAVFGRRRQQAVKTSQREKEEAEKREREEHARRLSEMAGRCDGDGGEWTAPQLLPAAVQPFEGDANQPGLESVACGLRHMQERINALRASSASCPEDPARPQGAPEQGEDGKAHDPVEPALWDRAPPAGRSANVSVIPPYPTDVREKRLLEEKQREAERKAEELRASVRAARVERMRAKVLAQKDE